MSSVLILALMSSLTLTSLLASERAYAQTNSTTNDSNNGTSYASSSSLVNSVAAKKVKVGDIDVSYKMFGKGQPLLLILGFSQTMNMWDPIVLHKFSPNHTITIFQNPGIANPIPVSKAPSSPQFANEA